MILVFHVNNIVSGLKKDYFVDHSELPSYDVNGVKAALTNQGVILEDCDVELKILSTIKQLVKSDQMQDSDVLDLATLYLKANKVNINSAQLCGLMSKSKNSKIRSVGEYVLANPQFQITKLDFFSFPNYAKEIFNKVEHSDNIAAKQILTTLIKILELKRNTYKRVMGLLRYPRIMFALLTMVFGIFCIFVIPNIALAIEALAKDMQISGLSRSVYDLSSWAVENKYEFAIWLVIYAIIAYKVIYFILRKTIIYVPFVYKIGFYKDHALFFGLLGTFQSAGIGMIEAFQNATEVITNPKDKKKMRYIVHDMITQAQDFGDGLQKYQYNKELTDHIIANRGLSDLETYEELKNEYTEEVEERVTAAAEYVEPASKLFIFFVIILLAVVVFGPLFKFLLKVSG